MRQDSVEGERSTGSAHKYATLLTFEDYSQKVIKVTVLKLKAGIGAKDADSRRRGCGL